MTNATTLKAISFATVIAVATAFSTTAFSRDLSKADENISAVKTPTYISKSNARNLVKSLLKRDYRGQGLKAYPTTKIDGKWQVAIKYNVKTVGTALVDAETGRISSKK